MDPYLVLGVPRDCTRQKVKETFRARVQLEHPDRGGEERKFIRLCTAYRLLLAELDRPVDSETPAPATSNGNRPTSRASDFSDQIYADLIQRVSSRSVAGKTRRVRERPAGSARSAETGVGATIAGAIAVMIFIGELLALVLTE